MVINMIIQKLNNLIGQGCKKCCQENFNYNTIKYSTNSFIEKAKSVHGNKYDYSKVNYVNNKTKVIIICPIHGEFEQTPRNHLYGYGCRQCADNAYVSDIQCFINKSKEIHGDKYDYSKVEYVNSYTKVCITCPTHGEFYMTPNCHLKGRGCKKCALEYNISETKLYDKLCEKFNELEFIHSYKNQNVLGKQEIDIFNDKYKIGIEYQGIQHFKSKPYFGGENAFNRQKELDMQKMEKCKNNGITLLHFTYCKLNEYDVDYQIFTNENDLFNEIKKIIGGKYI